MRAGLTIKEEMLELLRRVSFLRIYYVRLCDSQSNFQKKFLFVGCGKRKKKKILS